MIKTVTDGNFEMDCISFGHGEKYFVILPGLSLTPMRDSADSVAEAYKQFADSYTVLLFDRIKNVPDDYTIENMARDTAAAFGILGIKKADIFGASQGGMIAICLASEHPELVNKLVVASSSAKNNAVSDAVLAEWISFAEKGNVPALNRSFFDKLYSDEFKAQFKNELDRMADVGTYSDCVRFISLAKSMLCFDISNKLSGISCPVLVIGSENDAVLSGDGSRFIASRLDCGLFMYDKYGHAVYDEAPDFKHRLLDFFLS